MELDISRKGESVSHKTLVRKSSRHFAMKKIELSQCMYPRNEENIACETAGE